MLSIPHHKRGQTYFKLKKDLNELFLSETKKEIILKLKNIVKEFNYKNL